MRVETSILRRCVPPSGTLAQLESNIAAASPIQRKLSHFIALTESEEQALKALESKKRNLAPNTEIIFQGQIHGPAFFLRQGWAMRYKDLADGRRQIINLLVPGDCIGCRSALFELADCSTSTLTNAVVSPFNPQRLLDLFKMHPRLGAALCWTAAQEEAVIAEHLVNVGRQSSYKRLGHLFLELLTRLEAIGQATDRRFCFPGSQTALADALGLSLVHVNRTLRRLRESGLVEIDKQFVTILDREALAEEVEFEGTYLHLGRAPLWLRHYLGGQS